LTNIRQQQQQQSAATTTTSPHFRIVKAAAATVAVAAAAAVVWQDCIRIDRLSKLSELTCRMRNLTAAMNCLAHCFCGNGQFGVCL